MPHLTRLCLLLAALPLFAAAAERQHVKASLIADARRVKPGDSFNIGLLLSIDPQWHIYWENPGESGSPTRVKFTAPAGVTIGPVQYPLPTAFVQPGDIKGYGYEDEGMLIARVTVPKDWPKGKTLNLTAAATWLNCKDICLPGKANVELEVEVADSHDADHAEDFDKWLPQLPLRQDSANLPFKLTGPLNDLTLAWAKAAKNIEIIPIPPDGIEVPSLAVDNADKITRIKPTLRLLGGEKNPGAAVGFLVAYDDENGQRHGVRLSIPLKK